MKLWKGGIEALIYQPARSSKADGAEADRNNRNSIIHFIKIKQTSLNAVI